LTRDDKSKSTYRTVVENQMLHPSGSPIIKKISAGLIGSLLVGTVVLGTMAPGSQLLNAILLSWQEPVSAGVPNAKMPPESAAVTASAGKPFSGIVNRQAASIAGASTIDGSCRLLDEHNNPVKPNSAAVVGNDIYFLDSEHLYYAPAVVNSLPTSNELHLTNLGPARSMIGHIPMQEFLNFTYAPARHALVILDKSGDLYEFLPQEKNWQVLRPNSPMGSPDPEYLDMAISGTNICLLDPERNQIWRFPAVSHKYFKDVMPWRVRPGDISVANGVGIAYDGTAWVLRSNGSISRYAADPDKGMAHGIPFRWNTLPHMRPSRLLTGVGANMPLYIVERENNRVVAVDKQGGAAHQFIFPAGSDLRGLVPTADGFYIVDGDLLVHRQLAHSDPLTMPPHPRTIDTRLTGLVMPLKGAHLPRHPGVWAGSRRLYRFGVHHGTDFFDDPGSGTHVQLDTPIYAADTGKVVRADINFRDMDSSHYTKVIYQCQRQHISTEDNENLLRGCQVWIDHGRGLITRYAHMDKIRPGLQSGMSVSGGDLLGYVGVSGTGENLPGMMKHPHLHFEVFLDGKYVGYGLTPSETIGVYEDIFGSGSKS
jgi:murein DD-endopeptidase MepM/ murein hydrolase activator NlpD